MALLSTLLPLEIKVPVHATRESGGVAPFILNLGTRRGEWSTSHPSHFTPG